MQSMPENNSLAIIGDQDIVLGFAAMGFKVYALEEKDAPGRVRESGCKRLCYLSGTGKPLSGQNRADKNLRENAFAGFYSFFQRSGHRSAE